jgi:hypothetical protein
MLSVPLGPELVAFVLTSGLTAFKEYSSLIRIKRGSRRVTRWGRSHHPCKHNTGTATETTGLPLHSHPKFSQSLVTILWGRDTFTAHDTFTSQKLM